MTKKKAKLINSFYRAAVAVAIWGLAYYVTLKLVYEPPALWWLAVVAITAWQATYHDYDYSWCKD